MDDLIIASRNPQSIIDQLQSKPHAFKLKGTGPIDYHLGCDYFRDEDGTPCVGPKKYIERMEQAYKNHFGTTPSQKVQSPLEKNDHPEIDDSPLLDGDGMAPSVSDRHTPMVHHPRKIRHCNSCHDNVKLPSSPSPRPPRTTKKDLWILIQISFGLYSDPYRRARLLRPTIQGVRLVSFGLW